MKSILELTNEIRDYAWGDQRYIPDFLNIANPEGKPFAELWMGAHPGAPSKVRPEGNVTVGLDKWIAENRESVLGPDIASRYGRLPYLFKLLAAGKSLSIQAHPSKAIAEKGYESENRAGIPLDAPNRNYRDDNHKPEIIMALTPFTAMIGFRSPGVIAGCFSELDFGGTTPEWVGNLKDSGSGEESVLREFFRSLLLSGPVTREHLLDSAVKAADNPVSGWDGLQKKWVGRLIAGFPGDIGALAPLFLNVLEIQPGEALYQPAGALHAYLEGFGLELMANSDNVLRGGLTGKHVDVPELMNVLNFESLSPVTLNPNASDQKGFRRFETPADEFLLELIEAPGKTDIQILTGRGPMIVLALEGTIVLRGESDEVKLTRGGSAFIPWSAENITISGNGRAALAGTGR